MAMIPLYEVMEETYAVYFSCGGPPSEIPFAPGGAAVPSDSAADWSFQGAATTTSKLPGTTDLRTSGPNGVSQMTLTHPLEGNGHKIDRVSLSFRYLAGYDSGKGAWPVLNVELVSAK